MTSSAHTQGFPRRMRTASQETLSPGYSHPSRTTPVISSAVALLSTMMGGGMLTLPFAFSQTGLLGGLILQLVSAVAGGFSLYILIAAARRTGAARYGDVAEFAFGTKARHFVSFLTLTLTIMCIVAYSTLLKDMLGTGLELVGIHHGYKNNLLLMLLVLVAFPISLNRSLGGLKFVTPLSLGSMVLLMLAVLLRGSSHAYSNWDDLTWRLYPESPANIFRALPIFVLAYMAHFNALEMHSELVNPTRTRLKRVIVITIVVSTTVYTLFGIAGYLWAGDFVQGDILNTFPADDRLILLGRLGLSVAMLGNIPLMVLPSRQIIVELLQSSFASATAPPPSPPRPSNGLSPPPLQSSWGAGRAGEMSPLRQQMEHVVYVPAGDEAMGEWGDGDQQQSGSGGLSGPAHTLLTLVIVVGAGSLSVFCPGVEVIW